MKQAKAQALTVLPPEKGAGKKAMITDEVIAKFAQAKHFYLKAGESASIMSGWLVMCGIELVRLHKELDVKRGRPSKNTKPSLGIKWEDAVQAAMGFSDEKARYCMDLAKAAGKKVPIIQRALLNPYKIDTEKLIQATLRLTNGETVKSLMQVLGIAKADPGANLKKDRHEGGNDTRKKATPEEEAQEHFRAPILNLINLHHDAPELWLKLAHYLPLELEAGETVNDRICLSAAVEELTYWRDALEDIRKRKAKAMHASRRGNREDREKEAIEGMLGMAKPE